MKSKPSTKSKNKPPKESSDSDYEPEYFLVEFVDTKTGKPLGEYATCEEKMVIVDPENKKMGKAKHNGKRYPCKLLKQGSFGYIETKAELFRKNQSIDTNSEDRPNLNKSKFFGNRLF